MKFDYHTHHERCGHAAGSIREYITAAIDKGMDVIGISDHTPAFALEEDRPWPGGAMAKNEFPAYIAEVLALKKEFAGRIGVRLGIEAAFLERALFHGVKVAFGSDAHEPDKVGEHYERSVPA